MNRTDRTLDVDLDLDLYKDGLLVAEQVECKACVAYGVEGSRRDYQISYNIEQFSFKSGAVIEKGDGPWEMFLSSASRPDIDRDIKSEIHDALADDGWRDAA